MAVSCLVIPKGGILSYNWNVYKLFKSGKRAKAPFHVFEYDDPDTVTEYFNTEIKENFTEKIRRTELIVLRSDLPQKRQVDIGEEGKKVAQNNRNRVLRKYINQIPRERFSETKTSITIGLIFCKKSNWRWQWAALEGATARYIVGISPVFDTYEGGWDWMQEEILNL